MPKICTSVLNGISNNDVSAIAEAFVNLSEARALAADGQLARTTQVVLQTTDGKAQISSADDGNVIEIFLDGQSKSLNLVQERVFLSKGEVYVIEGIQAGTIITSTKGISGASGNVSGGNSSPMPLGIEAFAGRQFFLFAFRNSSNAGEGQVYVAAGAVPSEVTLLSGDGSTAVAGPVTLPAFGFTILETNSNSEFQVVATQPVFVGIAAEMDSPAFYDMRLVPPLSTELIGYGRSGFVSALYANTTVNWYRRDGTSGSFLVSPGSPVDLEAAPPSGTGANNPDYQPDGCLILRASGPISAFSGADSAGLEATPFYPLGSLAQRIPIPLGHNDSGDGGNNGIAVASPYEGTVTVFNEDGSVYITLSMTRGVAATTPAQQLIPAADQADDRVFPGTYAGGYAESDVPFYLVHNTEANEAHVTSGITTNDDEIVYPGVTPNDIRAEIVLADDGLLYKRVVSALGVETWVVA